LIAVQYIALRRRFIPHNFRKGQLKKGLFHSTPECEEHFPSWGLIFGQKRDLIWFEGAAKEGRENYDHGIAAKGYTKAGNGQNKCHNAR
jgi:hypothetical protein